MRTLGLCVATVSMVIVGISCGPKSPTLGDPVSVSGTVTLDGKPLANATIYFTPDAKDMGSGSSATTDANGKYELATRVDGQSKKGAIPGKYRVWFSRLVDPKGNPIPADSETPPADLGAMESLPPRLSDVNLTEERAEVSAGGDTIDFKLTTKRTGGRMPN